jgi:hypothetical protein
MLDPTDVWWRLLWLPARGPSFPFRPNTFVREAIFTCRDLVGAQEPSGQDIVQKAIAISDPQLDSNIPGRLFETSAFCTTQNPSSSPPSTNSRGIEDIGWRRGGPASSR